MGNSIVLVYPPHLTGQLWVGEIEQRLLVYGGIEVFLKKAAYFAIIEDFLGYLEVSLEIFDNYHMPYFEENTLSDLKYKEHKLIFKQTVIQLWMEITEALIDYIGRFQAYDVTVSKQLTGSDKYIIAFK